MRTLIVDDEPLARARLRRLLNEHPDIAVIGEAGHTVAAQALLDQDPDLVFLDIEMPGESGLAWATRLRERPLPPAIIFTTAHPQHALDAFAASPVDYLLKPIEPARLAQAIARARQPTRAQQEHEPGISIQVGRAQRTIRASQVVAVLSEDKYTRLIHSTGEALIDHSLKEVETLLGDYVLRIHRNSLLNRARLTAIRRDGAGRHFAEAQGLDRPLEISRRALPQVRQALGYIPSVDDSVAMPAD